MSLVAVWNGQLGLYFLSDIPSAQAAGKSIQALKAWTLRALHQVQTRQPEFLTIALIDESPFELIESLTAGLCELGVNDIEAEMGAALHSTVQD